jgi:hypothetical protein
MGTDIFLKWDGMAQAEEAGQLAASRVFRLDAGHLGYLRAAIGMRRENSLLRFVFPARYWYNTTQDSMPFDFKTGLLTLNEGAEIYLKSVKQGTEPDFQAYAMVAAMDKVTDELAKKSGFQTIASSKDLELDAAVEWLRGVAEFYGLGVKKMEDGKNPRIYIGW